jgi:DNA-binding NtrC family response regulator
VQRREKFCAKSAAAARRVPYGKYMPPPLRVLIVEPDEPARQALEAAAAPLATVEGHAAFGTARERLDEIPFDFLVTNVRLRAFNGLHLVYLSLRNRVAPRAIVYSNEFDSWLALEAQRAGALYDLASSVSETLAASLEEANRPGIAAEGSIAG